MCRTTDPDMWTCKRCGLRLRDYRCSYRRRCGVLVSAGVALALLATPVAAQQIGPGPCHSETQYGCYQHRLHLPMLIYDEITVGDDATPEPAIVTPTPTPTPTPTATATPIAVITAILVTVAP